MSRRIALAALLLCAWRMPPAAAEVVLDGPRFRAVLGDDATWQSLTEKASGRNVLGRDRLAAASIELDGKWHNADRATRARDRLTFGFARASTELVYRVLPAADWMALELEAVRGARPGQVTLLRLGTTVGPRLGSKLNAAWDDDRAVCLRPLNLATVCRAARRKGYAELSLAAQDAPGPKLEGSGGALIVAPTAELKGILSRLAERFGLPRNEAPDGTGSRDLPAARESYLFLRFGESEVDQVVAWCRRLGIGQVMLSSDAWCTSVGHYLFNEKNYPDGAESLRRTVARLHEAGVLVGMHTFVSKVSKRDPYVTPVPDRRFWVDAQASLAADVGPADREIRTAEDLSQWPGSPVARQKVWEGNVVRHQEVILDNEIIRYERIGPEGKWDTFLGCQRGAWKTAPAGHRAGTAARHYGVDGCIDGYIIDPDTTLLDEVAARLAEVFNRCDFDMVYFDGSEDVPRTRYACYEAKAHAAAMVRFTRRPLVHMGGGFAPGLWHSFTRDATVDQYPGTYLALIHAGGTIAKWPTCKDHIDRSVRRVRQLEEDMTPGELGWFGLYTKRGPFEGLQLDEIEYLMTRSLGLDAPISLQTSLAVLEKHPLSAGIEEIVRSYQDLRRAGRVGAEVRSRLAEPGKDFVLYRAATGAEPQFVAVEAVGEPAGTRDLRAMVGALGPDAVATVWHSQGRPGQLILGTPGERTSACDIQGRAIEFTADGQKTVIGIGSRRTTLRLAGQSAEAGARLLAEARFVPRPAIVLWRQAEEFVSSAGQVTTGSAAKVADPEAIGDFVLAAGSASPRTPPVGAWHYTFDVPHAGSWTLWARVRYPTGGDLSFSLVSEGPDAATHVVGNCGAAGTAWHWTGSGGGRDSSAPGQPIVLRLPEGRVTVRISPREATGRALTNPRLDAVCLSDDPEWRPTDEAARRALER